MSDNSKHLTDSNLPVLSQVQVKTPCPKNWDEMEGDAQKRYCGHCQKHVHNFEEMAAVEVKKLLDTGQSVCAKVVRLTDGTIVTKEDRVTRRSWFTRLGGLAASFLALITLGGCQEPADEVTGIVGAPPAAKAPVLLGEVEGSELGDVMMVPSEPVALQPNEPIKTMGKVAKPETK